MCGVQCSTMYITCTAGAKRVKRGRSRAIIATTDAKHCCTFKTCISGGRFTCGDLHVSVHYCVKLYLGSTVGVYSPSACGMKRSTTSIHCTQRCAQYPGHKC